MHRLAERPRGMQQRDIFGMGRALHAERAADVVGEHAQFLRLDVHGVRELAAHIGNALRRTAQGELLAGGIVARGRAARLERGDHQPLVDEFDAHDMGGVLERMVERRLLLAVGIGRRGPVEGDIAGRLRPELRRAGRDGGARIGYRGQRLIVDRDLLAGVLRRLGADRDHHRHRLAYMQHAA